MRLVDLQLAFPPIVLAIGILTMVEPGLVAIAAVLGVVGWVQYARIVRAQTLSLREPEFVVAARVIGARDVRILLTHILPNAFGPILVIATVNVSAMILAEASLSFLGIGVRPPTQRFSLVGQSMGGHHAMYVAATHPERVERLVISDMEPVHRSSAAQHFGALKSPVSPAQLCWCAARRARCYAAELWSQAWAKTARPCSSMTGGLENHGHLMMLEPGNLEVADVILEWLEARARA